MKLGNNILFKGASGSIGGVFLRKVRGQQQICLSPGRRTKQTANQKLHMERFRQASIYAKTQIQNPVWKSEYEAGITTKKHSAYLVAMSDYLHAPEVHCIDTDRYSGKKGDTIIAVATDDFIVIGVRVAIINGKGVLVEEGQADPDPSREDQWRYDATVVNSYLPGTVIRVTAYDKARNATRKEVVLHVEPLIQPS
jgi:hypothetical protein